MACAARDAGARGPRACLFNAYWILNHPPNAWIRLHLSDQNEMRGWGGRQGVQKREAPGVVRTNKRSTNGPFLLTRPNSLGLRLSLSSCFSFFSCCLSPIEQKKSSALLPTAESRDNKHRTYAVREMRRRVLHLDGILLSLRASARSGHIDGQSRYEKDSRAD